MVKKAKHLTFSQHNLDLFPNESYLPYCQAWQDRPLEDVLKLNLQGSLQETKSYTAEGPVSDACGTECVLWCHTEGGCHYSCSQNTGVSGGVNAT